MCPEFPCGSRHSHTGLDTVGRIRKRATETIPLQLLSYTRTHTLTQKGLKIPPPMTGEIFLESK